ncbi:MAG: hypothetical protein NTV63_03765 [Candidatus Woesearchaeota archaeon]|nr:hypothetical protein [Candidatus Woesearchaeota archaeon]
MKSKKMISFACKPIIFDELLKCSFGLNKTEYSVFMLLIARENEKAEGLSVSEIAVRLKKERTVIQKAVKSLFEKKMIKRFQENLENGGYKFSYSPVEKREIKERIIETIRGWVSNVESTVTKW